MSKNKRILISGGGIAGLTAAIWLARAGMKPVIVEKAKTPRVGGFLVALSHQAYLFAQEMDLMPHLRGHDLNITSSSYHDRSGRSLLDLDYTRLFSGLDIIQITRDDLARVLFEQAKDKADIRFGESIQSISQGRNKARVKFTSGAEEEFDIVIGADGVHSAVRQAVFSPGDYKTHYLDLYVAAYKLPNVLGIHNKFETHMERSRYMAVHNTRENDIGAVFVWDAPGARDVPAGPQREDFLLNAYHDTTAAIEKILKHCPKGEAFYMDALSQIDMPTWHKGNCVLVGDAAHCLTLFSGRGAAAAFAGACRLAKAIIEHNDLQTAFRAYEAGTRPIIEDIMPATRNAVCWYVPRSLYNHMIRDNLMRFVPNAVFRKYFRMKYSKI